MALPSPCTWVTGRSLDLDLFSTTPDVDLKPVRERLVALGAEVVQATPSVLRVRLDGETIDVVRYPYAPLEPPSAGPAGFPLAGLHDLGAMKLAAIARRGIRRDFWDLFEIVRAPSRCRRSAPRIGGSSARPRTTSIKRPAR